MFVDISGDRRSSLLGGGRSWFVLWLSTLDDHRSVSFACARELGAARENSVPKNLFPVMSGVDFLKWGIIHS